MFHTAERVSDPEQDGSEVTGIDNFSRATVRLILIDEIQRRGYTSVSVV